MKRSLSSLMLILLPLTLAAQSIAPDYETARQAVDRGDMLPLEQILARIEARHPGRIVEVELEDEDGLWLYEIEVLTPEGRLIEIELDARTGAILGYEEDDD